MRKNIVLGTLALFFILFTTPIIAYPQATTGILRGFVTDEEGEPLPGVNIEIQSEALMSPRYTVSDGRGLYRFLYLPPGRYTICAKLEGFEVCWVRGVAVQVGQTTTADIVLKTGKLETTIDVKAEAPLIDTESASRSYSISRELLATIPLAPRLNYTDIFYTLPGVAGASLESPLVNAGSITHNLAPGRDYFWDHHNQDDAYENKIYVDGMEINDSMSGTSYAKFNYEAIEEVDVKTAGASAEYGNARSSFMNIVTKSGGNRFEGSFLIQYQAMSFNDSNVKGAQPVQQSYLIPNFTLSGPIMKDKLWFLLSYKYENEDYILAETIVVKKIVRKTRGHMPLVKLTFQPTAKHLFSLVYQNDYHEIDPSSLPSSRFSTLDTAQIAKRGGPMFNLTWRWLISNSFFFNFSAGYNHKPRDTYAKTTNPRYQYTERFQGGSTLLYDKGYGEDYYSIRENLLFTGHFTYFNDNLFNTGYHEIKFGIEVRPYQHVTRTRKYHVDQYGFYQYRLGLDYEKYGLSEPYIYRAYKPIGAPGLPQDRYDNEVTVSNQNIYIQDSWVVNKNLSLNFGIRWEHQREYMFFRDELPQWMDEIYEGMRNNVEFDDSGFAPRFGLAYNLKNIGTFKIHLGRYYEYVGTGDYNNYARTMVFAEYRMDQKDIGKGPEALKEYYTPPLAYPADFNKDMKMEYNDEFMISFERPLPFFDLVFETNFIYRNILPSYMEDINTILQDGKFLGYRYPEFNKIWMRTYYSGDDRRWRFDYKGLQFNIKRTFKGRWGLMANYSFMWRNYYKLKFDPTDPYQYVYSSPRDLDMHNYGIRWAFHVSAFYRLPWDILLSAFFTGNSGIFISDVTGDYAWDATAPSVKIPPSRYYPNGRTVADVVWQAKNSYYVGKKWGSSGRYTDDVYSLNVRLAKRISLSRIKAEIGIDVYNVFNWCAYSMFESADIRRDYVDSSGLNRYQNMTGPQSPRRAQLNIRFEF